MDLVKILPPRRKTPNKIHLSIENKNLHIIRPVLYQIQLSRNLVIANLLDAIAIQICS